MRTASLCTAAALLLATVACSHAVDVTSGIDVGSKVGSYKATKCGGPDDGIQVGKALCFT